MQIVSVIEMCDTSGVSCRSFSKDNAGRAEEIFFRMARENGFKDEQIEIALEDGYIECGNYCLYIVWGTLDEQTI